MLTYTNMNMKKTWQGYVCKIVAKIGVEQTKENERSHCYLYPFGDLAQGSFQRSFYVCIKKGIFLGTFLIGNWLWVNWNLIKR
jgi:hypothetical protein